ncbi:MAG: GWxTD domain-containing protein [Candidatus Moduliflexus flocculans]|nr:GWxTD domain-containing protein [Candidatus Moduliflexus flocculans]
MRRAVLIALLLASAVPLALAQKKPELPPRYKKWLDEEVVYIIAAKERSVFLQLRTDKERDIFVEAFWKQRDPTVGTHRNEFQEEHYRRFNYANSYYGRSNPLPGWRTDRRPDLHHPRRAAQHRAVRQRQRGLPDGDLVLPGRSRPRPAHRLQRHLLQEGGRRRLHSLFADRARAAGPDRRLHGRLPGRHPDGGLHDQRSGRLQGAQGARAQPGPADPEPHPRRVGPARPRIPGLQPADGHGLQRPAEEGRGRLRRSHPQVQGLRRGRVHRQLRRERGRSPGHPRRVGREPRPLHHRTRPDLGRGGRRGSTRCASASTGRVSDAAGKTVYQFDKDFPFSLTGAELEDVRAKSISIQDAFPLVPGSYNFDILLKNVASKEFTGAGPGPRRPRHRRTARPGLPPPGLRRRDGAGRDPGTRALQGRRRAAALADEEDLRHQGRARPLFPALRPDPRAQGFRHPSHRVPP